MNFLAFVGIHDLVYVLGTHAVCVPPVRPKFVDVGFVFDIQHVDFSLCFCHTHLAISYSELTVQYQKGQLSQEVVSMLAVWDEVGTYIDKAPDREKFGCFRLVPILQIKRQQTKLLLAEV